MRHELAANAWSRVGHVDAYPAGIGRELEADLQGGSRRGIADTVHDDVLERLPQPIGVGDSHQRLWRLDLDLYRRRRGQRRDVSKQLAQVDRRKLELE